MIAECPECETEMRSNVCACGYRLPAEAPAMPDYLPEPVRPGSSSSSYRARWYAERGLDYEPPKLTGVPPFRCVGGTAGRWVRDEPGSEG